MQRFLPWLVVLTALVAVAWLAVPMFLEGRRGGGDSECTLDRAAGEGKASAARLLGTGTMGKRAPTAVAGRARIHGRVVGPDNAPLADVGVEARPWTLADGKKKKTALARRIRKIETAMPFASKPLLEGRSDADGAFELTAPRKKRFRVRARPGAGRCTSEAYADLTWQEEAEVTVHVLEAAPLDGRVLGPGDAGVEAVITARCKQGDGAGTFRSEPVETEAGTGAFRILDLPEGRWEVIVRIPGRLELTGLEVEVPHEGVWTIHLDDETGRVVGTVTSGDDQGLAHAQVLVHTSAPGTPTRAATLATTDLAGHYEMAVVPVGKVRQVEVLHRGFVAYRATEPLARWSGAVVKPGAETRVDVVLGRGAVIEGRVFDVQDDAPLVGARVMVLARTTPGQWTGAALAEDTSGEDGRFRLEGVPSGRVLLLATHPTHYLAALGETRTRTLQRQQVSMQVTVPPPALFLVVGKDSGHLERDLGLTRGAGVAGRVVDPAGKPVEGARIGVLGNPTLGPAFAMGFLVPEDAREVVFSDAAGHFEIQDLPPSDAVVLKATKVPYVGMPSEPTTLTVDGPIPEVELRLQEGAVFLGRVVDMAGEGIGRVTVTAWGQVMTSGYHRADVQTEADGHFRLEGAPYGEGTIQASGDGWAADEASRVPFKGVKSGEVRDGFEIRLSKGGRVSGVLVDEEGEPVPGQSLVLSSRSGTAAGPAKTDEKGRFTFEHAPAGKVRLSVSNPGMPWRSGTRIGKTFESPAEGLRFVYRPPPIQVIEGRVLDPQGAPVPLCTVSIRTAASSTGDVMLTGSDISTFADEVVGGTFRRVVHGKGPWEIEATGPRDLEGNALNLRSTKTTLDAIPKGPVTLRLEAGHEVWGRVLDENDVGMPGVIVESGTLFAFSDSAGRFVLRGLAGTGATVTLGEVEGYVMPDRQTIASLDAELVFHLGPSASIVGRLVDTEGNPVQNGFVQAQWKTPDGGISSHTTMAQGSSRFEISLPRDAVAQITVRAWAAQGGQRAPTVVKDVPAGTTDLVITIGGGVEVSGTVVDEEGKPFTKGWVRLARAGEDHPLQDMPYTPLQTGGTFRVLGLEPGRYTLSLQRNGSGPVPPPREITAPSTDLRIVVTRGGIIAGRLVGDTSVGMFEIRLAPEGNAQAPSSIARTDADGNFLFEGVDEGTYTLRARKEGHAFYGLAHGVRAGDEAVELALARGLTLEGTLLDASGTAVAKGWISASNTDWSGNGTVEDGHFTISGLPPGTYQVRAAPRTGNAFGPWVELGREEAGARGLIFRLD